MRKMTMPNSLSKTMTFHSDYCQLHTFRRNGEDVIKPVQKMVIEGEIVCPRCESEKREKALVDKWSAHANDVEQLKRYNTLYRDSLVSDATILAATLENYTIGYKELQNPKNLSSEDIERLKLGVKEQQENLSLVKGYIDRFKDGQIFNVIFQGVTGVGKSHLGYGMMQELNNYFRNESPNKSCLFISVDDMFREIKGTFKDKESKYTEQYFVKKLSGVDFLVLDDLGAENGSVDSSKEASNFVQTVLNAVTTARQDKTTIVTTNVSSKTLYSMYGKRIVSRIFKHPEYVIFKHAKDKRPEKLPF